MNKAYNKNRPNKPGAKLVHKAKNRLQDLENALNYVPQYFSYKENFQDKEVQSDTFKSGEKVAIYLGKMHRSAAERKSKMYNDEFIKGLVKEIIDVSQEDTEIYIKVAPDVSKHFNGAKDVEGYFSPQEEIEFIKNLLEDELPKKYKKLAKNIHFEDLCDSESGLHKKLFQELEKYQEGNKYEAYKAADIDTIDKNDVSSFDIAEILVSAYRTNKKFKKQINNIAPNGVDSTEKGYYVLTEIAIRLTEFLKGFTIQGGGNKQTDYDLWIRKILKNISIPKDFPELAALQQLCNKILYDQNVVTSELDNAETKETPFRGFYFSTKSFEEAQKNLGKVKGFYSKIKYIPLALLSAFGIFKGGEYSLKKQMEDQKQFEIKDMRQKMDTYVLEDVTYLDSKVQRLHNRFLREYGEEETGHEEELYALIQSVMYNFAQDPEQSNKVDFDGKPVIGADYMIYKGQLQERDFLKKEIIDKYAILLKSRGFDVFPNKYLQEHEKAMIETIELLNDSAFVDFDKIDDTKELERYYCIELYNSSYDIATATINANFGKVNSFPSKKYFVAKEGFSHDEYNAEDTKKMILDYVKNSYPEISQMAYVWNILGRYPKYCDYDQLVLDLFYYIHKVPAPEHYSQINQFRDRNPISRLDYSKMYEVMDEFAKLKIQEGVLDQNTRPFGEFENYKKELASTAKAISNKEQDVDSLWSITYEEMDFQKFIGYFAPKSTGEVFSLYQVTINHKTYIVPRADRRNLGGLQFFQEIYKEFRNSKLN